MIALGAVWLAGAAGGSPAHANQSNAQKPTELPAKTVVTGDEDDAPAADKAGKSKSASRGKAGSSSSSSRSIVALVNDEPITSYELQQRAAMLGGSDVQKKAQENFKALIKNPRTTDRLKAILNEIIKANPGKSRDEIIAIFEKRKKEFGISLQKQAVESARSSASPKSRQMALDELIDERLKAQEAKRQNVTVADDEVDRVIASIAERNKMTAEQFKKQVGPAYKIMANRIRSNLAFNEVIKRRYGAMISVTNRDVDSYVATASLSADGATELQLQRIRLAMPSKMDQAGVAQRLSDAEAVRAKFKGCASMAQIAESVAGAKFEDLGKRKAESVAEPTRSMLLNASDGEILPPTVGEGGVELWAVCGRSAVSAAIEQRSEAEGQLKQKQFELLSKRHLKDLRQDAHIEYR